MGEKRLKAMQYLHRNCSLIITQPKSTHAKFHCDIANFKARARKTVKALQSRSLNPGQSQRGQNGTLTYWQRYQ